MGGGEGMYLTFQSKILFLKIKFELFQIDL